uniref:F-box/kelch-repeat protein At3g06240-like n=1 Tax=Erigeron canadensis TaxID=72917 RepID=UPI001CB9CE29|nr:F-box/kelch-repeat protein At3g06240-like [Erigeron canadensis]
MVPFQPGHVDFTFRASCNGLVLMSARDLDSVHKLLVINPTTTEYVELSDFGLDMLKGCESILRTDTWTRVIDSPYDHHPYDYSSYDGDRLPGVFTNGFLHWVAKRHIDDLRAIVAFSLAHECFGEVPLPESCYDTDIMSFNDWKLCVLGGKLAIFSQMKGEVWIMNEYGVKESWIKIRIHGLNEIPMIGTMIFQDMDKILLASNNRLLIYGTEERRFSRGTGISHNHKLVVKGAYVESLFSPIPSRTN